MEVNKSVLRQKYNRPESCSLEVLQKSKLSGKINVKVRLTKRKYLTQSISYSKVTPTTLRSLCTEENNSGPIKVFVSLNSSKLSKPDDFIEPLANLSIPSTQEYMKYRCSSELLPVFTDLEPPSYVSHTYKHCLKVKNTRIVNNHNQTASTGYVSNSIPSKNPLKKKNNPKNHPLKKSCERTQRKTKSWFF
jgi:hypothetical protein